MLTPRDFLVLKSIAHYYCLTRAQVTRLHFPDDVDGRATRKRLQALRELDFIGTTKMQVVNPSVAGAPAPVFYPTKAGAAYLAQETQDERCLAICTHSPNWQHLLHWTIVSEYHILLDQAAAQTTGVAISEWFGEWSVCNPEEQEPHKRFTLYTLLSETPRLICKPDAGFLLEKDGYRKVYYLEADRDTTKSAERVAARKSGGFAGLFELRLHLSKHFPGANVEKFTVLVIAPTEKRRDALRRAFATKPQSGLYRFAAAPDLAPATMLTAPVWLPCVGDPVSLLKGGDA